jgi:Cu2+-exporting ATPase/Cu+-exporting ATPase
MIDKIYNIKGMHCASCSLTITKKLSKLDGINDINVNFATEKANIIFDDNKVDIKKINNEIEKLGYSFEDNFQINNDKEIAKTNQNSNEIAKTNQNSNEIFLINKEKIKIKFVLPVALIIFIIMVWDILSSIKILPELQISMDIFNKILMIISTIILFWIGKPFIFGIVRFIKYRVANMDTLIGIGTLSAYIYSTIITFFPQIQIVMKLPEYTYFDVVIVVIGFVTFGKYLEARSKQKTGEAIEKLIELQAKTAIIIRDGIEIEIPISEVAIGEIIIVKPGMKIPVDGKITEGFTSIDEGMITGESIPVDKNVGDIVIGATINKQGSFRFIATKVGKDTMLSQIIKMVEEAQGSKAPIEALVDKVSSIFVPSVLLIAVISFLVWIFVGIPILGQSEAISYGLLSFVGVLIIACPCALGLATPTAIIVGVGIGAKNGILIKNAESLELLSKVDTIVLDKTGTITKGKPEVTDVVILDKVFSESDILKLAGSVEKLSEHPLALSIVDSAILKKIILEKVTEFISLEGVGVRGIINDKNIYIHKPGINDSDIDLKILQEQGKTVVVVEVDNKKVGLIALSDTIKDEAKEAIAKLHKKGIKVIMLTGDNHLAALYIAKQVNIDEVISEVLPNEKAGKIELLQNEGRVVAMAGDGINDAPALVQANVGIAMATGSDIAIESAGIALLHGDIHKISQVIDLSKATMRTIKQNLFWAFIYNMIGIPIAAGLLFPIWGIVLNPIFAGLAMAFSSVSVVGNSLRLKTKKI